MSVPHILETLHLRLRLIQMQPLHQPNQDVAPISNLPIHNGQAVPLSVAAARVIVVATKEQGLTLSHP